MSDWSTHSGHARYETPEHPFRDILRAMTGKEPPGFVRGFGIVDYSGDEIMALQDWCASNVPLDWMTGIGLLEAAERQVEEAIGNANILPEHLAKKVEPKPKRRTRNKL